MLETGNSGDSSSENDGNGRLERKGDGPVGKCVVPVGVFERHAIKAKHGLDLVPRSEKAEILRGRDTAIALGVLLKDHCASNALPASQPIVELLNGTNCMRLNARKIGHPSIVKIQISLDNPAIAANPIFVLVLGVEVVVIELARATVAVTTGEMRVVLRVSGDDGIAVHVVGRGGGLEALTWPWSAAFESALRCIQALEAQRMKKPQKRAVPPKNAGCFLPVPSTRRDLLWRW